MEGSPAPADFPEDLTYCQGLSSATPTRFWILDWTSSLGVDGKILYSAWNKTGSPASLVLPFFFAKQEGERLPAATRALFPYQPFELAVDLWCCCLFSRTHVGRSLISAAVLSLAWDQGQFIFLFVSLSVLIKRKKKDVYGFHLGVFFAGWLVFF